MPATVTQLCNGVPHGQTYTSKPSRVDQGHSEVFASSLFVHVNEHGEDIAKPKDTDDKVVVGYTSEGMGFQIIVDGFYGCDRRVVFNFIDKYVIPLMEKYSQDLSLQEDASLVTKTLIHNIYNLRKAFAPAAEFTMSLGMTYKKEDTLNFAGFGIGDTGLVIKHTDGTLEQLSAHTEVAGFKDAFDDFSHDSLDSVIDRNSLFNTKVLPGDEIMGYTYAPPELETLVNQFEAQTVSSNGKVTNHPVRILNLDLGQINKERPLFPQFLDQIKATQEALIKKAKDSGEVQRFGDDFSVGRLIIPDTALMHKLRVHVAIRRTQTVLQAYISRENQNKGLWGVAGFFNGATKNVTQASLYKNLLDRYQDNDFISLVILLALTDVDNPIGLYLVHQFGLQADTSLHTKLEELLSAEIEKPALQAILGKRRGKMKVEELELNMLQYFDEPTHVQIDELLRPFQAQQQALLL
jgi:hypothetical protein